MAEVALVHSLPSLELTLDAHEGLAVVIFLIVAVGGYGVYGFVHALVHQGDVLAEAVLVYAVLLTPVGLAGIVEAV